MLDVFSKLLSKFVVDHFCGPQEDAEEASSAGQAPGMGGVGLVGGGGAQPPP